MKTRFYKLLPTFLALLLSAGLLSGCIHLGTNNNTPPAAQDDIIVLFTGDVHCGVDNDIGYAGLAAYKNYCESITPHTALVDCGDAVQGDLIGAVSDGEYVVDIMNELDYDFAVPGNHEFDYGMEQFSDLVAASNTTYLSCNITYTGTETNAISTLKPYEIVRYGDISVAYIGVTTPATLTSSTPTHFMENGEFVYQFNCGGPDAFYDCVQGYIDECLDKGADYVILLTHLGDLDECSPYSSVDLIQHTTNVDAVLDGHAHSVIPCRPIKDKENNTVLLSATGTKLDNIGQLTISAGGTVTVGLISELDWVDDQTDAFVKDIQGQYEAAMSEVIGRCESTLSCYDTDGIRMVRNREVAPGNLCADAYRAVAGADIGLVNGGGVRADLEAGDITYADIIALNPFGNSICMVEATGQEILDALEISYCAVQPDYRQDGKVWGENGGFLHVSGLKLTVDTSVPSPVVFDEIGMVASIGDARRVKDVMVLSDSGEYLPIDPNQTYTVASHNYLLKEQGGNHDIFSDNVYLIDEGASDYEVLITYIRDHLNGEVGSAYAATQGRINVQ